jgi:hypothetical protein
METLRNQAAAAVAVAALAALSGCAGLDSAGSGPAAEVPVVHVGDRWVYRATDGFRAPLVWNETHEVVRVMPDAITVRVTETGPNARAERVETWATPGKLASGPVFDDETRAFTPPVTIYAFPMAPGQRWNQWVDNVNATSHKSGQINRYVTVDGWDRIATPAGSFDALRLRVLMRLDDDEFWRGPTECNYLLYYAPAAGAIVRAEKSAEYWEKGDRRDGLGAVPTQRATLELTSYTRAP